MTTKPENQQTKNVFVILGFARSGTSVITRGLQALGVDLGDNISKHKKNNRWNPTGFFEDEEIIFNINTKVYHSIGHRMHAIPIIPSAAFDNNNLSEIKAHAKTILHKRFLKTHNWGFKNPSTTKIIPFWRSLFDAEQLQDHYIIALRNPLSSAHSFSKLTNIDIETALLLWLTYIIPAIDETGGRKRMVVSYELMMQDPITQLLRMKSQLDINTTHEDIDSYTQHFLDNTLQHNRFNDADLKTNAAMEVTPLCLQVYKLLMKTATDELTLDCPEFVSAWKAIKHKFEKCYPVYCYIDTLLQKNKTLRRKVRSMEKSIPWKLLYPLRWLDDTLRKIRTKNRLKSRFQTAYE